MTQQELELPKGWVETDLDCISQIKAGHSPPQDRKFFKNTNFSMLFNYKSSQKYEDFLSDVHPVVDNIFRFPIKKIPETILFDLQLSKNYTNYKITGIIKNIFNKEYVLIQHYPMPGRTWQINFSKQLN